MSKSLRNYCYDSYYIDTETEDLKGNFPIVSNWKVQNGIQATLQRLTSFFLH